MRGRGINYQRSAEEQDIRKYVKSRSEPPPMPRLTVSGITRRVPIRVSYSRVNFSTGFSRVSPSRLPVAPEDVVGVTGATNFPRGITHIFRLPPPTTVSLPVEKQLSQSGFCRDLGTSASPHASRSPGRRMVSIAFEVAEKAKAGAEIRTPDLLITNRIDTKYCPVVLSLPE